MKSKKKNKIRIELTVVALIAIILMTQIIPHIKAEEQDPPLPEYLFLSDPTPGNHSFLAKGECYLYADIDNTDYITVELDEEEYELSYGINTIPVEFSEKFEEHTISFPDSASTCIKSFAIEPLFIAKGNVTVNSTIGSGDGIIDFSAGGLISILLKPNFSYNELVVQLDQIVLKDAYVGENYPVIDSQIYSYFAEAGSYLRFDITVQAKSHLLSINGNGSVEYVIMINDDWDEDDIPDVLEVQKRDFNGFRDLDPTNPNIWGFFEKSEAQVLIDTNETSDPLVGHFNYHINKPGAYFLTIQVEEGEFFDIEFDGDSTTLKNTVLNGSTSNNRAVVNVTGMGWHYISYNYLSNYNNITFLIQRLDGQYKEILVLDLPQLIDSDGDGVKNVEELNSNLKHQGSDSDGDGLPDNYDNSPYATLILNNTKINRFVIPNNPQNNSIVSIQIKKPNNDYSTKGIPRLWRETLNVSITPALRLFGNRYQLFEDSDIEALDQDALVEYWGKDINTYNLVSGYNSEEIFPGDPLPNAINPDNETTFVYPNFADETWEFEFSFLKDNPAKGDNVLDLRFDFIWILTNYISETNSTEILHYYNIEEEIILQSLTMREIGDIDYILATPDNFVENQILWTLLQNPTIGTFEDFGVDDDVISNGTVDFFKMTEQISLEIEQYYSIQTERNIEAEVSYYSGLQDSYDLLNKYKLSLNNSLDSPILNRRDFRSKYSYYSINNVYQDEDIQMGDPEVTGEQKTNYIITQDIFNENQQVATLSDLPIAMEMKNFPNSASNILEITSAISEPIPLNEIPIPIPSTLMHPKIKLMKSTFIERNDFNEQIPKVNFDVNIDIEKSYFENRAHEFDRGELFFESHSTTPSEAEIFASRIGSFFRIDLKNLDDLYGYFNTKQGLNICSADIFNPYREFDNFLDNYIDENGQFQVEFLKKEPIIKLQDLGSLEDKLDAILGLLTDKRIWSAVKSVISAFSKELNEQFHKMTSGMRYTRADCDFYKFLLNQAKEGECYASRGKVLGKFRGKLAYHWDKLKTNFKAKCVIEGVKIAIAGVVLIIDIASAWEKWVEQFSIHDPHNVTLWRLKMAASFCNVVMGSINFISGIMSTVKALGAIKDATVETLESFVNCFSKAVIVIGIILIAIDITTFFLRALSGEFEGSELLFQTITLIVNVAVAAIGLALAAASISTVYGAVFGVFIAAMTFLGMWLSSELNKPSIDVQRCSMALPTATKLNMRRHGGLEVGDTVNYELKVKNNSTSSHGWIRANFMLQETEDPDQGWITDGGWRSYGYWGAGWWEPPFGAGATFETIFSQTIPAPTTNLHQRFDLEYDWQRFELIIIIPTWWRTTGTRHTSTQEMRMPVLDNNIADFYNDTCELMSTTLLKQEFERALNEYQWKDASDIAEEIISRTESKAKTPSDEFVHLNASKQEYDEDYYLYHTTSSEEFYSLIETHYESGIIAKVPVPADIWHPNRALGPKMRNMLSYNYSNGDVLITHDWFYNKTQELGDSVLYSKLLRELPIRTNIRTDLRENPLDIDPDTKKCHANFQLYLEGPDNPDVDFVITPPEDFSITQTSFTQRLQDTISLTIIQENPYKIMGLYYFELNITLNDVIIYSTFIPIRINDFSLIDYIAYIPTEPINPGDSFKLLDVVNLGTLPDSVVLTIEGIPGDFIYKDLHPDEFFDVIYLDGSLVATYLNGSIVMIYVNETETYEPYVVPYLNKPYENVQFFNTMPGGSRESLEINPPRKYTSVPGLYEFNITAINPRDGSTYFIYQGSFIVAEFYDLDFQCYNPAFSILDNETCTYYFNITNLGNTEEVFTVTYTDIGIASSYLDEDTFVLAPGQTGYFEIMLDPLKIGHQEFVITVASEHITKYNLASITIADDDVDPPVLSDLLIEDDIHHIFATLKACDYSGISEFKIYIDGILIEPQIMTQIGDYYSFVLNNEWILLYGIHEIDIYVTDADDDRAFDNLTSSISGLFEISLDQMYEYVDWQIEVLKEFVEENTYCSVSRYLNKKLSQAQTYLHKALEYCESGEITCGLWKAYYAKLFLRTAEHKTEIYNKISWIDNYIAGFIINSIREIRNNVAILMGVSTDPEIGYDTALIEIELLNLYDFVEQNVSRWYRSSLNNYIKGAEKELETALFKISMDINPNCSFTCAQWKLDKATCKVNWLLDKGKISQELADILFAKIDQINLAIEELKYLI